MAVQPAKALSFEDGTDVTGVEIAKSPSLYSEESRASVHDPLVLTGIRYDDDMLDTDLYGFTLKAFFRDGYIVAEHDLDDVCFRFDRMLRMIGAFILLWASIAIQAALIYCATYFVGVKAVDNIREVYDKYEMVMYGAETNHYMTTAYGNRRGIPEYFQPELFATMGEELKEEACSISLSRPFFLATVLFIWSLTCVGEFRRTAEIFKRIVIDTRTSADAFVEVQMGVDDHAIYVRSLHPAAKATVAVLILLPRLLITATLLWLGSRWLVATANYKDLVMDAVGLAFIKDLKDLLYTTLVSVADKRELELTRIQLDHCVRSERTSSKSCLKAAGWGVMSLGYVFLYIFKLQTVLPDYQWDVSDVCEGWVARQLKNQIQHGMIV